MAEGSVTFLNGYSPRRGSVGLLAFPDALPGETTFTRFFSKTPDDQWFHTDFNFDCRSLTAVLTPTTRAWWLLGKNGESVEIVIGGKTTISQIPGAGLYSPEKRGYLDAIKNIAGDLFACGYQRQVYRRLNATWVSIADDILTKETGRGFFDIDGSNTSSVYAVGWHGEIFRWDGRAWQQDDSPTTAHLAAVRCVSPEDVWICGNSGIVLHGRFNNWEVIDNAGFSGNWYAIEEFNGTVYLAANQNLASIVDGVIRPVDVGLKRAITTHRLHAKDGLLWSIGEKDILVFDGQVWKEILHPDNI